MAQSSGHVVIVGGGYGGVRTALDLLRKSRARITLIDEQPYHMLPTEFYELASMFRTERAFETWARQKKTFEEFLHTAAVPFKDILYNSKRIAVIQGSVEIVLPSESQVKLKGGSSISYDWLVLGMGSKTNYFDIPHLEQNAFGFKSVHEALNIRNRIDELFRSSPKHKIITVIIGGGGVTGCELAAELAGYMEKLASEHNHPHAGWSCLLVEARDTILNSFSPWIQDTARRRLASLGVNILTESRIVDVWPNLLYLEKERRTLSFDMLIWTTGVTGKCAGEMIKGVDLTPHSCVEVGSNLLVGNHKNIFAIGDMASRFNPRTGEPLSMTAQKAITEGAYAARAIAARIKNPKARLALMKSKHPVYVIPLGGKYALLHARSLHLKGRKVWALKQIIFLKYLMSILRPAYALRFWLNALRSFARND